MYTHNGRERVFKIFVAAVAITHVATCQFHFSSASISGHPFVGHLCISFRWKWRVDKMSRAKLFEITVQIVLLSDVHVAGFVANFIDSFDGCKIARHSLK